jgi:hypothetical protein
MTASMEANDAWPEDVDELLVVLELIEGEMEHEEEAEGEHEEEAEGEHEEGNDDEHESGSGAHPK